MQLTVADVSELFHVPVNTVYRWINEENLPAHGLNERYFINRAELVDWATVHHIDIAPQVFRHRDGRPYSPIRFTRCLQAGGLFDQDTAGGKAELFGKIIERLPVKRASDRESLLELFLAREQAGSTVVGQGIAIPHPMRPIVLAGAGATITVFYLNPPLAFDTGGQIVHTLFVVVAPTVQTHLHLLARICFALQDAEFLAAVSRRCPLQELLEQAMRVESKFDKR